MFTHENPQILLVLQSSAVKGVDLAANLIYCDATMTWYLACVISCVGNSIFFHFFRHRIRMYWHVMHIRIHCLKRVSFAQKSIRTSALGNFSQAQFRAPPLGGRSTSGTHSTIPARTPETNWKTVCQLRRASTHSKIGLSSGCNFFEEMNQNFSRVPLESTPRALSNGLGPVPFFFFFLSWLSTTFLNTLERLCFSRKFRK